MRRSKNKKNNRETGSRHELQAAAFLTDRGYVILEKNYRCRTGEIDLIAKDGGYLVFVEVKFRSSKGSGDPAEAVDAKKKSRIAGAARYYLLTRGYGEETMTQKIIKKTEETVLTVKENRGVTYLSFPILEDTGLVSHAFSTRLGGVSKGDFATMNFSFTRGDDRDDVLENYRRMAAALGVDRERMVLTWQTHTTNVRRVTEEDEGKGIVRDRDYRDVDGLITDIPGITLVTFFADCVPLYFLDPVHKAIGLSHSGWRGTVKRMGQVTVDAMKEAFGTRPEDIIACIGPSICGDCYEVGEEVADEFADAFHEKYHDVILLKKQNGKYQLDLWKANEIVLKEAGIKGDNLAVTNICTYCNPQLLFSHRRTAERRGNLCAFLSLKEK